MTAMRGVLNFFQRRTATHVPKYSQPKVDPETVASIGGVKRNFKPNQTYDPQELNQKFFESFKKAKAMEMKVDVFKTLKIDPLSQFKNVSLLSHFVTDTGSIRPRRDTGLTIESQRRLSRAIKRAQAFGLMPVTYKL
ncbi:28S ribosomal protein S18c, mitochondrial [Phlyctochytrium planicorne]|nr:28S ribosomal protein S18c, mitochondrial [Phlyctochytrium planicorne]